MHSEIKLQKLVSNSGAISVMVVNQTRPSEWIRKHIYYKCI